MKELLSLSVLYITLAFCWASCFRVLPKRIIRNGELVTEKYCIDDFDGNRHPPGSVWNTEGCLRCSCLDGELGCCTRYGGILIAPPGCIAAVDPETCRQELYNTDSPSEPCF